MRAERRLKRGQTLVLGALSFLVLALMVTLSFNLSQALRAKISLQQHSDSLAYSMAVMEARALNYYAVTNRAIAASYVAMNSLHAYMAAASVTGEMMQAGSDNFSFIAFQEGLQCGSKKRKKHCRHAREAMQISREYSNAARSYARKARGLEGYFISSTDALDRMVDALHASQRQVHGRTREAVSDGMSHGLRALALFNAPGVSGLPGGLGSLNANELDCAVDGMECTGSVPSSSPRARAQVLTEISNATRPGWPANRAGLITDGVPWHLHPQFLDELRHQIPGDGTHEPKGHAGTAKTALGEARIHEKGQEAGNPGTTIAADEHGTMFNKWSHVFPGTSRYSARIWSDANGGGHSPGSAHSGNHRFEGVNAKAFKACASRGNCFMKFRANPDPRRDWGQPRVYSYVTQSLRMGDPAMAPWELNASGEVTLTHGEQGASKLTLAPGEGAGLSKALVYYHRFDNEDLRGGRSPEAGSGWREPPNLFAPYWRAKLHPMTSEEAERVLRAAGNSEAAQLVQGAQGLTL
ncbi:MAG: hypothetical protein JXB05_26175 [Myxococcaceae bacterium]|nr:hypothetical protein [Myxococcaceae bacterium]